MSEGLPAAEVGKEIEHHPSDARADAISVVEAILLALVALVAGWSGFASAKWSTESRLALAQSATARAEAGRAELEAMETRNFDSSTFTAWFTAYVAGDQEAMKVAEKRFRPGFRVAFDAWLATNPATNPKAAPGPTYVPEYKEPKAELATALDHKADEKYTEGQENASTADNYVRITVYLATVLFLVGISGHFKLRAARYGLVTIGVIVVIAAVGVLTTLPAPPG